MTKAKTPASVKDFLEYASPEAKKAYKGTGPAWESPDVFDDSVWYEWCDDCETWHTSRYPRNYEVSKGKVELIIHSVDQDGNSDFADSAILGDSDEEARLEKAYGFDAWRRQYKEYLQYVAETGEDPVGEFFTTKTKAELKKRAKAALKL